MRLLGRVYTLNVTGAGVPGGIRQESIKQKSQTRPKMIRSPLAMFLKDIYICIYQALSIITYMRGLIPRGTFVSSYLRIKVATRCTELLQIVNFIWLIDSFQ